MLNIFQIAANDQSIYFLGQIFGNVGFALAGAGPALLGNMFKIFNTALLAIAALMITYTTVVGVLKTAHEGKFMGEKWNSLWIPLRMVMGIVALMPTKAGYCVIQVIFMWFIVQGIGAADMIWARATDYLSSGGPVQTPVPSGTAVSQIPILMNDIYSGLVCQSASYKFDKQDPDAYAHAQKTSDSPVRYDFSGQNCGYVAAIADDADHPGRMAAQGQAIGTMVPVLEALANYTVGQFIKDKSCWNACTQEQKMAQANKTDINACRYFGMYTGLNTNDDGTYVNSTCLLNSANANNSVTAWNKVLGYSGSNFMTDAVRLFAGYAYNYTVNQKVDSGSVDVNDILKRAAQNGWVYAGAYYYYIARQNNQNVGDFVDFVNTIQKSPDLQGSSQAWLATLPPGFRADAPHAANNIATTAANAMTNDTSGGIRVEGNEGGSGPSAALSGASYNIISTWTQKIAPSSDSTENPLVTLQHFGADLLLAAEILFWVFFAIQIVLGALSSYFIILGTTVTGPVPGIAHALSSYLIPPVFFLILVMATLGGTLGVYVPLIPYMLFTFGAIGWMIVCIEAMVAAPIVALGILAPGGEHEIFGRAQPVPMILLNIFLRPTLMIFGLMAGFLMSYVVIYFINGAFYNVLAVTTRGSSLGLLEAWFYIVAYTGLVVTSLNKCFSLIHHVPDKVLRWLGQPAEGMGEEQAMGEVKGKVQAGGEGAGKVTGGVGAQAARDADKGGQTVAGQQKAEQKQTMAASKASADSQKQQSDISKGGGGGPTAG